MPGQDQNRMYFLFIEDRICGKFKGIVESPIPDQEMLDASSYKNVKVDIVVDSNENLRNVNDFGIASIPFYLKEAVNNPTYKMNIKTASENVYLREGVCEQLVKVNKLLSLIDLELVCYDGYRSIETQEALWKCFLNQAHEKGLHGDDAKAFAIKYCSNPSSFDVQDSTTWPVHSTGGAVDAYIRDKKTQKIIDFGEGYFDNPNEITHTRYFEKKLLSLGRLSKEENAALRARRLMYHLMVDYGNFANFPYECFHYDYKDQFWGRVRGVKANFAYIEAPKEAVLDNSNKISKADKRDFPFLHLFINANNR